MKLSVVIPAHNEEGGRRDGRRYRRRSRAEGIEHEVIVVDDDSGDRPRLWSRRSPQRNPRVRCRLSHRNGFGFAVRAGLEAFEGDAVAIVMADGSDDPEDLVCYQRLLEDGYECAFGSRFVPGPR